MKMKDENNLVRRLDASETMGGASQICSDKTGTLTQNIMKVVSIFIQNQHVKDLKGINPGLKQLLVVNAAINSNANIMYDEKEKKEISKGSQSEVCLLNMLKEQGEQYGMIRSMFKPLGIIPFSSERKKMTTIYQPDPQKPIVRILVKGAAEIILERSSQVQFSDNETQVLTKEVKDRITNDCIKKYAEQAYRNITFAYKDISLEEY